MNHENCMNNAVKVISHEVLHNHKLQDYHTFLKIVKLQRILRATPKKKTL